MKKIFTLIALAMLSVCASAQVWLGGEIILTTHKTTLNGTRMDGATNFTIAPEVGYNLSDTWAVALQISYTHMDNAEISFVEQTAYGNCNQFTFKPYVRCTFLNKGGFSLFADGGVDYSFTKTSSMSDHINSVGVSVNPGIAYALNDKVSLVAHIGEIGYTHTWCKYYGNKLKDNAFDFKVFNNIGFGAYVNL